MNSYRKYFKKYSYLLGENKAKVPTLIGVFFASSLLDMFGIGLLGPFVKIASDPSIIDSYALTSQIRGFTFFQDDKNLIISFGLAIMLIFYIKSIFSYLINKKTMSFAFNNKAYLINRLVRTYQKLDYNFHVQRNTSALIQRLLENTNYFTEMTLISSLRLVSEGILVSGIFIILLLTDYKTTIATAAIMLTILFFYDKIFRKKLNKAGSDIIDASESVIRWFYQAVFGFKEIRILGAERFFYDKIEENGKKFAMSASYAQAVPNIPRFLTEAALVTIIISMILITIIRGEALVVIMPVLGTFAIASFRLVPSLNKISASSSNLRISKRAMDDLYDDLILIDDLAGRAGESKAIEDNLHSTFGLIQLDSINFSYSENKVVLRDLSLEIPKGSCIGIIGKSGEGKTTLLDLLLGFHKPISGALKVDEIPIDDLYNPLKKLTAYVPQTIFVIDDTIEKNITFEPNISNVDIKKLEHAIKLASLSDYIYALPEGYNTVVGEHGAKLSGGQKQRIALARAFYHDKQFIIIDEGTSALDIETETQVVTTIKNFKGIKTLLVVTHRKKILDSCDVVYSLSNGTLQKVEE